RLLACLFDKNSMISSAFRHDLVENIDQIEKQKMMEEAEKVAQQALMKLESVRKDMKQQPVHVPTWTGRYGVDCNQQIHTFGKDESTLLHILRNKYLNSNSGGGGGGERTIHSKDNVLDDRVHANKASSRNILANIKLAKASHISAPSGSSKHAFTQIKYEHLVRDLHAFMKERTEDKHNSTCTAVESADIIAHFQHRLSNETEQYLFRVIVQNLCKFVPLNGQHNKKGWILKPKFLDL
ncbi:chromatin remodeling complex subunit, partial [Reticulomyxa filosa]